MIYLKYLRYIIRHKWFVLVECFKVRLIWRGLTHDLSKFFPNEFITYARHFYGRNETKYKDMAKTKGGYSKSQDRADELFDCAWLSHIHRNPHHWQHWILIQDEDDDRLLEIPPEYVSEMICDWRGAGKAQGRKQPNELTDWYDAHKDKMKLNEQTRRVVDSQINNRR